MTSIAAASPLLAAAATVCCLLLTLLRNGLTPSPTAFLRFLHDELFDDDDEEDPPNVADKDDDLGGIIIDLVYDRPEFDDGAKASTTR